MVHNYHMECCGTMEQYCQAVLVTLLPASGGHNCIVHTRILQSWIQTDTIPLRASRRMLIGSGLPVYTQPSPNRKLGLI